ncbi:hypothetical protein GAY29_21105 [Azospirillum brasilense]|uniref:hypothetical protein n=1 Tax=Azospirillum brasilense TaxID=192 RepID=UPI00190DB21C|nr:hypothetical protein [Azospirillum brasilense]MBK3735555.1 hypothetical protein [Azospirillum brasilense]
MRNSTDMHPNLCCVAVEREGNRVNLLHRNWRAELRCIPFTPSAARELAAELVVVADEIEASQPKEASDVARS